MSITASARERFLGVWGPLRDELVAYLEGEKMPADAVSWFKRVRNVLILSNRLLFTLLCYRTSTTTPPEVRGSSTRFVRPPSSAQLANLVSRLTLQASSTVVSLSLTPCRFSKAPTSPTTSTSARRFSDGALNSYVASLAVGGQENAFRVAGS